MNTITHLLEQYDGMVNEGLITRTEAQNIIKPMLSGPLLTNGKRDMSKTDMTLGLGDFLFVFDSKGNMIMHPELEGKNLLEQTNPEGRFVLKEIMAAPNNVLLYQWKNPSDTEQKPMITVNHYFAPWDWHIGLATYETNFYGWFESLKYLLISIVLGSYVITAILLTLARRKEKALRNSAMMSEHLSHTNESILMTLAVALEERDSYTSGHSQRVAYYMREIAKQMGY
ncbi:cache domain-containing protein, partial [Brevibacillus fluminis]